LILFLLIILYLPVFPLRSPLHRELWLAVAPGPWLMGYSGPFGATQLWHNIIHALKTQVEVRHCRRHLRVHADCFMGSDAVDAVLSFLMQNVVFSTSEVSRLKAARLCQALMEAKVFEPVGTKLFHKGKEVSFEDSTSSLYRFMEPCTTIVDTDTENPVRNKDHFKSYLVEEVWKQQTLLQLLQTVEVPVLDSILNSPPRVQRQTSLAPLSKQDLVISNTCLERELMDTLNLPQLDEWLSAAADLLELFPDQLIVAAGEQLSQQYDNVFAEYKEQLTNQKRVLFDIISKYYNGQEKSPLIPGRYLDIHIAILQLINDNKIEDAIKAFQLCFRLLDTSVRDELKRLVTFMATAAHPEACCLQKQMDNKTLVCRTFQKAIVQNYKLHQSQTEALLLFLISNHTELFKIPKSVIDGVRGTLRKMQQGEDPDTLPSLSYRLIKEYEDQCEAATLESLKMLLHNISMNKKMPAKQKKRLLKEFEKHHPPGQFIWGDL
uniref:DEP domain-containing protein n=1 Tax=Periophthalmus magnuspinnatus TaxID=409849 RepID=A0A3B3ZGY2_9GOBI